MIDLNCPVQIFLYMTTDKSYVFVGDLHVSEQQKHEMVDNHLRLQR